MNLLNTLTSLLSRFPTAAAIFYLGVVVSLGITAWTAMAQIQDRRDEVADTAATLAQLEGRTPAATPRRRTGDGEPLMAGSPLLEGATMTVGGANLLQRVATAIAKLGGTIQYTQVDLEGPQAKDGFVSVTVNCEVTQPALQQLLYDLEAGMPFLFIDQLVAQGPATQVAATPGGPEPKLRVLISVSGQWQGQASK
jgi:general secretion pathway protein M